MSSNFSTRSFSSCQCRWKGNKTSIAQSISFSLILNTMYSFECQQLVQYAEYAMYSYRINKFLHIKTQIFKHKISIFLFRYWFIIIFQRKQKIRTKQKSFYTRFMSSCLSFGCDSSWPDSWCRWKKKQQTFDHNLRVSYITIYNIHACIYIFAGNSSIHFRKKSNFFHWNFLYIWIHRLQIIFNIQCDTMWFR